MNTTSTTIPAWARVCGYFWVIPAIYYFFVVGIYTTNLPYGGDDIELIVGNTAKFLSAPNMWSALPSLFVQCAESQTFFITLSGIISTKIFGYIDFYAITLAGNLALFATIFFLVCMLAKSGAEFNILALPAFLLLGAPVGDCTIWANCTIGHFGSIFAGALVSLVLIRRGVMAFILFEVSAIAAILVQGNGAATLPLGFLGIRLFQEPSLQKRLLYIHALVSLAVVLAWIVTLERSTLYMIGEALVIDRHDLPRAVFNMVIWVVAWFGSWASLYDGLDVALLVGVMEIALILFLAAKFRKILFRDYSYASMVILYLVVSIVGAASLRSVEGGQLRDIFADRYKTYSLCLTACLVVLLLSLVRDRVIGFSGRNIRWHALAMGIAIPALAYNLAIHYQRQQLFTGFKRQQLQCAAEWVDNGGIAKPCRWHGYNKTLMDQAISMHILYIDRNGSTPLRCDGNPVYAKYCWK